MKTAIYTITHKKFVLPNVKGYKALQVGADGKEKLGYTTDCTGDNISKKNNNYCELTGLYWIWKNDKENDLIGISHYRRYFTFQRFFRNKDKVINEKQIKKIFEQGYEVILPYKEIYRESAYEQYCIESGTKKDLENIKEIIENKCPDYLDSYNKIMNQNLMYQFNMMICSKKIYDSYCKWLFDILFELEKVTDDLKTRTQFQQRIYGFLSERLLNVWMDKNKPKIKQCRVINVDMNIWNLIKLNMRRVKNYCIFKKSKCIDTRKKGI